MTSENSLLVKHRLVPVEEGQYPFSRGQVWAEPDVDHAAALVEAALDDRARVAVIAARGRSDIRLGHNFRAVGVRILDRIAEISAMLQVPLKTTLEVSNTVKPKRKTVATGSVRRHPTTVVA